MSSLTLAVWPKIGHELGISSWSRSTRRVSTRLRPVPAIQQWIHVDTERAKRESPFRTPIAHGYLTLAMVAPLAMEIGVIPSDAAAGLNYGSTRFASWLLSRSGRASGWRVCSRRA